MTITNQTSDVERKDTDVAFAGIGTSSFIPVIDNIVAVLEADSDISSFCFAQWKKGLTVKKVFRFRQEIGMDELPLVMITRPSVEKSTPYLGSKICETEHTLNLYCGFLQNDRKKAHDELVRFEELIDSGDLTEARAIAALYLARRFLKQS